MVTRSVRQHGARQPLDRDPVALVDLFGRSREEAHAFGHVLDVPSGREGGSLRFEDETATSGSAEASSMAPTISASISSPVIALRVSGRASVSTAIPSLITNRVWLRFTQSIPRQRRRGSVRGRDRDRPGLTLCPSTLRDEPTMAPSATSARAPGWQPRRRNRPESSASGTALRSRAASSRSGAAPVPVPETIRASAPPRSQVSRPACSIVRPEGGVACLTKTSARMATSGQRLRRSRDDLGSSPDDGTLVGVHHTGQNVDPDHCGTGGSGDGECRRASLRRTLTPTGRAVAAMIAETARVIAATVIGGT